MNRLWRPIRSVVLFGALPTCLPLGLLALPIHGSPNHLTCDSLTQPLGIDDDAPALSWQLQDDGGGAHQTAYLLQVATSAARLAAGKPDIWSSGRVTSDRSVGIPYGGPALAPEKRYYWRVTAWDKDGKPYPISQTAWWETGLRDTRNWQGKWIGYEDEDHRLLRTSGAAWITNAGDKGYKGSGTTRHDFRFGFDLAGPVRHATLYVAGKDTAAAWVNGQQVLQAQPLPPWKQFPWQTYVSKEVTADLRAGRNLLAVEVTLYSANPNGMGTPSDSRTPMNAALLVEMADGSRKVLASAGGGGWKATLNGTGTWQAPDSDDPSWPVAVSYTAPDGSAPGSPWPTGPVKLLRKSFDIQGPIRSARLYITALGAYQARIDGQRVGDQVLAPGWMDFREHVAYQVYDVSKNVKTGSNVVGAYLAPGWYTTPLKWARQGYNYGDTPPALKAQLRIEHPDGSVQWIATDETWQADVSPILKAEIYDGETYDARRVQPGWDSSTFAAAGWKAAQLVQPIEPQIVPQSFPPIRVEMSLMAKAVTNPKPGVYIYDFAQNLAGVASIQAKGPAGTDIQLRFAEVLNPDGTLYVENLRTAKATDHFILAGHGVEHYQPAFTFHGFRYVEVTGLPTDPGKDAVKAVVFHTDAPLTTDLHTGSAMINQLWENILWGQRSNFLSVPTDCPQRDERLGWTADAQVFWRTASYNMDLTQFSKKFAADLRGTQTANQMYGIFAPGTDTTNPGYAAGWSDAGVIIPWTAWLQSGDTRAIEENWTAMQNYLGAIEAANPDFLWQNNYGTPYGDWLSPEGPTKESLVATAYWAYDVTLMQQMAHALGKTGDEARYRQLFARIKAAFQKQFVHPDGHIVSADNGPSPFGVINNPNAKARGDDTQTGYVLALEMNLLPDSLRQAAAANLVAKIKANGGRLNTGFLGTPYLLAVLVDTGHPDVAYSLLLNTDYPSWGYLVDHGATTMWERWNGDQMRGDPSMNSYNHYAYGAVADWIYRYAAGIDATPTGAGFHTIDLHPVFDARLGNLDFTYQSPYGKIKSSWTTHSGHTQWTITIPPNATGQLPQYQAAGFTLDGVSLDQSSKARLTRSPNGTPVYELASGTYTFHLAIP